MSALGRKINFRFVPFSDGCRLADTISVKQAADFVTDLRQRPNRKYRFAQRRQDAEGVRSNELDRISGQVLDVSIRLHRELGPGLLESVYETVLAIKLLQMGHTVDRQKPIDIEFDGLKFEGAFRIDLLVADRLLIEIKSVERLNAAHAKQLLTYLRLTKSPLGLLINFGGATLKEGFRRLVNNYDASAS